MDSLFHNSNSDTSIPEYAYTRLAELALNRVITSDDFRKHSDKAIYSYLRDTIHIVKFGDHLKRYLFENFDMGDSFSSLKDEDFSKVIRKSFKDTHTPFSFGESSRAPGVTIKFWLNQPSVRRSAVFLLGFGLKMPVKEVDQFLTKVLNESSFNMVKYDEVIIEYCLRLGLDYEKAAGLIRYYETDPLFLSAANKGLPGPTPRFRVRAMTTERELKDYLLYLKANVIYENRENAAFIEFETLFNKTVYIISREREISRLDHLYGDISSGTTKELGPAGISYNMVEKEIYSGISETEDGNLRNMNESTLKDPFQRYRLTRQKIDRIMKRKSPVERFDLITLLFYIYAHKEEAFDDTDYHKDLCLQFIDEINAILFKSGMIRIYPVNPYEAFILLCLISPSPWDTFCEVWTQSFSSDQK